MECTVHPGNGPSFRQPHAVPTFVLPVCMCKMGKSLLQGYCASGLVAGLGWVFGYSTQTLSALVVCLVHTYPINLDQPTLAGWRQHFGRLFMTNRPILDGAPFSPSLWLVRLRCQPITNSRFLSAPRPQLL